MVLKAWPQTRSISIIKPLSRSGKFELHPYPLKGFPGGSDGKESTCNEGDHGSIPDLERSPGGGYGNSLQYSFLENFMDRGAWWATVHGVPKSWSWLVIKNWVFVRNQVPYWNKIGTCSELKERSSSLRLTRFVAIECGGWWNNGQW